MEDVEQQSAWARLGSLITHAGEIVILVFLSIVWGVFVCCLVGLPITAGSLTSSVYYWLFIAMIAIPLLANLTYFIGLTRASLGAITCSIVFFFIATALYFAVMILLILALIACSANVICGNNYNCAGTVIGPYTAPTGQFLAVFIVEIANWIIFLIAAIMAIWTRRDLTFHKKRQARRYEEERIRTMSQPSPPSPTTLIGSPIWKSNEDGIIRNRQQGQ